MLLVCVLAGEYLSTKKERTAAYVRERIEWEKHIQQLAEEGPSNDYWKNSLKVNMLKNIRMCFFACK